MIFIPIIDKLYECHRADQILAGGQCNLINSSYGHTTSISLIELYVHFDFLENPRCIICNLKSVYSIVRKYDFIVFRLLAYLQGSYFQAYTQLP